MSVKLMWAAMNVKAGSPTAKLILLKLADNANEKGECWPSLKNISEQCEVSQKTVIENIKRLEKLGLVTKTNRFNEHGKTSNIYMVTVSSGEVLDTVDSSRTDVKKRKEPYVDSSTTPYVNSSHESINKESIREPVRRKGSTTAPEAVKDLYNKILSQNQKAYSLPFAKVITGKREKVIRNLLRIVDGDLTKIEKYFTWLIDNADSHRWLFGENRRGWVADIEFVCRDETFAKATENRLGDWSDAA